MKAKCPHCGFTEEVPDEYVGETGVCEKCGKEFVVGEVVISRTSFDASGSATVKCPSCGNDNVASLDYGGRNVRCCECNEKFHITIKDSQQNIPRKQVKIIPRKQVNFNKSLPNATMVLCPNCHHRVAVPDDTPGLSYKCNNCGSEFHMIKPTGEPLGCETMIGLAFVALVAVLCFCAAISEPSNCGGSLAIGFGAVIAGVVVLLPRMLRSNTPNEEVRREARRILAEEERLRNEEERLRNEDERSRSEYQAMLPIVEEHLNKSIVTACNQIVRLIISSLDELRRRGKPPTIYNEYFSLIDGEEIYFYAHNVDCKVPHARSVEDYRDGTLAITNKRVVFACEDHKQTYRIDNIRDFKPTWLFNLSAGSSPHKGEIDVASSEKRREIYSLENSWLPTLLLMFLWNDSFRERALTTDPLSVAKRIIARASVRCDIVPVVDGMVHGLQPILDKRHKRLFNSRAEQVGINVYKYKKGKTWVSDGELQGVKERFEKWAANVQPELDVAAVIKRVSRVCNNVQVLREGSKMNLSAGIVTELLNACAGW